MKQAPLPHKGNSNLYPASLAENPPPVASARLEQLELEDTFSESEFRKYHHPSQELSVASAVYKNKKFFPSETKTYSDTTSSGYVSGSFAHRNEHSIQDSIEQTEDYDSSSSSDDSEWDEEEWPSKLPLPLPLYGCERPELQFSSTEDYLGFAKRVQNHLEENVSTLPYDSLSSFVMFCTKYRSDKDEYDNLAEFFRDYDLPVLSGRNTCVGLSSDLLSRLSELESKYPGLKDSLFPVSCEEDIADLDTYCANNTPPLFVSEKEHVLICLRFRIEDRFGVMILDPGYHFTTPITVMRDEQYPQSDPCVVETGGTKKVNSYSFFKENSSYVIWNSKKIINDEEDDDVDNVIFINKPFLSGLDIAERRNLVYPVKSLLNRNKQGTITSGLYIVLKPLEIATVTVFFNDHSGKQVKVKIPLSNFLKTLSTRHQHCTKRNRISFDYNYFASVLAPADVHSSSDCSNKLQRDWEDAIDVVAREAGRSHEIYSVLHFMANILNDSQFLEDISNINEGITENSSHN